MHTREGRVTVLRKGNNERHKVYTRSVVESSGKTNKITGLVNFDLLVCTPTPIPIPILVILCSVLELDWLTVHVFFNYQ